jgi:prepilin signal peptidase PulO-like enzyme (type II secretory pathway)
MIDTSCARNLSAIFSMFAIVWNISNKIFDISIFKKKYLSNFTMRCAPGCKSHLIASEAKRQKTAPGCKLNCLIFSQSIIYIYRLYWKETMRILMLFLWLIFGSLGSVMMTRFSDGITLKKLRGFFFGRSECPHCKHVLQAKHLIPVVSYLVQWGKCAYCKKKISRIYPVLELLCAWIFVVTYFLLKDFWIERLIFWLLMNRFLILLLIYDLQKYELHMVLRVLFMALGIVANINVSGGNDWNALMSAIMFGVTFLLIYFFAKRYVHMRFKKNEEWFGQGDVFLAVSIWILFPIILSFHHLPFSLMMLVNVLILFILMSSIIGLIRAWLHYLITKKTTKIIPFFPAMIIAFRILAWKAAYFIPLIFW